MKRILLFFGTLLLLILLPIQVYASEQNTNVVLQKGQIVNNDYFAVGETVTFSGTVNGDAYVAGANVIVEGIVNGDLLAAGGTVTIRGKVSQDVRVVGGQINITGEVGRNITTFGGSVDIADSAKVNGSLTAVTGNLNVFAPINKDINIGAGQLTIGNSINGDVQAGVGQLMLTPQGRVNGNLTYWSDAKAQINDNFQVSGKITHHIPPQPSKEQKEAAIISAIGFSLFFSVLSFLAALIVGLLLVRFMPVYVDQTANIILKNPFLSLGVGFLTMIVAPFVFFILLLTVIGIPLDLILIAGFLIFIYLAKIYTSVAIGKKALVIFNKKANLYWTLIIGLSIYYLLSMTPFIGFVVWIIAGLMGLGAIFIERKNVYSSLRKKGKI